MSKTLRKSRRKTKLLFSQVVQAVREKRIELTKYHQQMNGNCSNLPANPVSTDKAYHDKGKENETA